MSKSTELPDDTFKYFYADTFSLVIRMNHCHGHPNDFWLRKPMSKVKVSKEFFRPVANRL